MQSHKNSWIIFSVAAGLFWGIWGVLAKWISQDVDPYLNHCLFTLGMLPTLPLVWKKVKTSPARSKGIVWGLVSGILAVIGNVAVYKAFSSGGQAAIVIPVTNLYPLITIVIAVLVFKEKLNWVNAIGVLLALPAIVMLSGQMLLFKNPGAFIASLTLTGWLIFSLAALFFWGVFSAAQKVATNYISAEWCYVSFTISSLFISLIFIIAGWVHFNLSIRNAVLGSGAGLLNGLGVLCSFVAYSVQGKASKVTTIAGSMQPAFTILLAVLLLHESMSLIEVAGVSIAIVGACALSFEKASEKSVAKTL